MTSRMISVRIIDNKVDPSEHLHFIILSISRSISREDIVVINGKLYRYRYINSNDPCKNCMFSSNGKCNAIGILCVYAMTKLGSISCGSFTSFNLKNLSIIESKLLSKVIRSGKDVVGRYE